jgi:hypothetical protein
LKLRNHAQSNSQAEARPIMSNDTTTLQSDLRITLALSYFQCAYAQSLMWKCFRSFGYEDDNVK